MNNTVVGSSGRRLWRRLFALFLIASLLGGMAGPWSWPAARAQDNGGNVKFDPGIDAAQWYKDHEIEQAWKPDYLKLATGDPSLLTDHGVYAWPFALDSIGWSMQSYQDYGGTPYFHHGMDMMKLYGTDVFNRSGGQVVNIENYNPGWNLYWEVAVLDPDGYIWQYHHIDEPTIPQYIWDKFAEYQADPVNGGFIAPNTYIGDIIEWPVWSFGKQFNHIHLNILAAGGVYVNGFEFHTALPDTVGPLIQAIGLLQNGQIHPGNDIEGSYSLYVRARDLILDDVYYLPPWEITFAVDCWPVHTTWRFDTLPGGADDTAYLSDFYVVPPTCGDYDCREYYIDLGFIPNSQYVFPAGGGQHTIQVTVRDYAGNTASQSYTYTVNGPNQAPIANPQSLSAAEDTPLDIVLTGSDPDCNPLTYSVVSGPNHGTLSGIAPSLTYTPSANYNGADSFTFVVNDGQATSDPATVDITVLAVNDAPVADPQSATTRWYTPVAITLTGSDVDGDALTFSIATPPEHGTLSGTAPDVTYTPDPGFGGPDSFAFIVNDGELDSEPAVVNITIKFVVYVPVVIK
jgi:Bacterial Ig domain